MSVKQHEAFCFDSFQDRLLFFDDFHGDQIQDEWRGTGVGAGTAVVVDQQTGGIVRLTTGAVTANDWRIEWADIRSLHVDKKVSMETRVKVNSLSDIRVTIALFFSWTNYIRFYFRPATSPNWLIYCVDGGAVTNPNSGIAADGNYHIFRIECHTHGTSHVHFYIDGTEAANSPINTNVPDDATDFLQPYLMVYTEVDASKSMDIDYVYARQER